MGASYTGVVYREARGGNGSIPIGYRIALIGRSGNVPCRRAPPLLREDISSNAGRRGGSWKIAISAEIGAPDTIRTCGLHLRRVALYPAELRVPRSLSSVAMFDRSTECAHIRA
jgi:hypothetical protein